MTCTCTFDHRDLHARSQLSFCKVAKDVLLMMVARNLAIIIIVAFIATLCITKTASVRVDLTIMVDTSHNFVNP